MTALPEIGTTYAAGHGVWLTQQDGSNPPGLYYVAAEDLEGRMDNEFTIQGTGTLYSRTTSSTRFNLVTYSSTTHVGFSREPATVVSEAIVRGGAVIEDEGKLGFFVRRTVNSGSYNQRTGWQGPRSTSSSHYLGIEDPIDESTMASTAPSTLYLRLGMGSIQRISRGSTVTAGGKVYRIYTWASGVGPALGEFTLWTDAAATMPYNYKEGALQWVRVDSAPDIRNSLTNLRGASRLAYAAIYGRLHSTMPDVSDATYSPGDEFALKR